MRSFLFIHTLILHSHTLTLTLHDVQSDDCAHFSVSSLVSGFTGDSLSLTLKETDRRAEGAVAGTGAPIP